MELWANQSVLFASRSVRARLRRAKQIGIQLAARTGIAKNGGGAVREEERQ
jgi:hypothetical protein